MRTLDFFSGQSMVHMEIQANERKRESDRLGVFMGMLRRECIHDVLMNERRIAVRERIGAELVVRIVLGGHGDILGRIQPKS